MAQEPELEEGETCCYGDDVRIDVDVVLSYIDDKVQSILGHLQKDFDGQLSAENLGPKYGGYGSFLSTYQRSPSIKPQQKTPPRVQNPHFPKSCNVFPEGCISNPVTLPIKRDAATPPPSMPPPQTSKISSVLTSNSIKEKDILVSDKAAQAGKAELPSNKPENLPDRGPLKVRIKMGSERLSQYNAEICSLGLTSPSSSEGNSHDESDGLLPHSLETPNESPGYMLKIMTFFPVSNGMLLSPLCEDLLNLARERECPVESEHKDAPKKSALSFKLLNEDVVRGKNKKIIDKNMKLEKSEDVKDSDQRNLGGDNLGCHSQPFDSSNCKSLPEAVRDSDKDLPIKRRNGSKIRLKGRPVSVGLVKDASVGHSSGQSYVKHVQSEPTATGSSVEKIEEQKSQKDVLVDHGKDSKNEVKGRRLSLKAYTVHSEDEGNKKILDDSIKTGLSSAVSKQNAFAPHSTGRPLDEGRKKLKVSQSFVNKKTKEESSKDGDCAAPKSKFSGNKDIHKPQASLEQIENPKLLLERPSSDLPKDLNLVGVNPKSGHTDKLNERSRNTKCFDKVSSDTHTVEPLTAAVHSKGLLSGLEETVDPHLLIKEDWVLCDHCEKWRLLPYGTSSEQLPDKWVCSMLDWLPGMNSCDISEDDTSAAIRASHLVPVSENQLNFQPHANGTNPAAILSSGDQKRQEKLKEKQNTISMNRMRPTDGKKQMQHLVMKGLKKGVNQCPPGINDSHKSEMHDPNKMATVPVKLKKRKSEDVLIEDATPKKKFKQPGEYTNRKEENQKVKSEDAFIPDNSQTPGVIGNNVKSLLPSKPVLNNGKKKSTQKDRISEVQGNSQFCVKTHAGITRDLPDNGPLSVNTCKRKTINEESSDGELHRDKRPLISHVENELKRSQGDDVSSKRKSAEAKVLSGSKEHPRGRSIEKEFVVKQPREKPRVTIEDIDKLRKDLGGEEMSMAVSSSSSKVSNSRKNRLIYVEREGSPVESVSSSPVRLLYPDQASTLMETAGEFQDANGSSKIKDSKNKLKKRTAADAKLEVLSNLRHPLSHDASLKSAKQSATLGKNNLRKSSDNRNEKQSSLREHDKNDLKSRDSMQQDVKQDLPKSSVEQSQVPSWNGKVRIDLRKGGKQVALCPTKNASGSLGPLKRSRMDLRPDDASKAQQGTDIGCAQVRKENYTINEPEKSVAPNATTPGNKNICASTALTAADNVLKEAEELKAHADLIKNSGFSSESHYEYFEAALKFLHGASLLEACYGEPGKHLDTRSMQMYNAAAQLFKICANGYDKSQELAAAALAYKCIEVAYMRVVYFRSSTTSRVWQDLQTSLQTVPQGESPSSSASDVDNLNNLAMPDKATLSKGTGSYAGKHVIVPHNRPNVVRLLDFMKYVNSAMESAKKSQDTFAAACAELEEPQNKDIIDFVKRVIDFSFQDVEEFVRLVLLAFNSINHQGVRAIRE